MVSRCPKGTRRNKKTGNCENTFLENYAYKVIET